MKKYFHVTILAFLITSQVFLPATFAAALGYQIDLLLSQVRTASGGVLAGGHVHFYAAGGTTPKAVYTDVNKNTQASNPYQLTSNGTALLYGDGLYRIVIHTSTNAAAYDFDNVRYEDLSSVIARIPRAAIDWGPGATQLPRYYSPSAFSDNLTLFSNDLVVKGPWVDVRAFGPGLSTTNGTDNWTTAFTDAFAAIATKGEILVPKGMTFKIDSTIAIGTKDIRFFGGGTIKLDMADVSYAFSVAGGKIELDGLTFTTATSATGGIVSALSSSKGIFKYNTATNLFRGFGVYWDNSIFEGNSVTLTGAYNVGSYGIELAGSGNKVFGNTIAGGRRAVYISGGTEVPGQVVENNEVYGNTFIGGLWGAVHLYATAGQGVVQHNRVSNNLIVNTSGAGAIDVAVHANYNVISGNTIYGFTAGNGSAGDGIVIEGSSSTSAGYRPEDTVVENNTIISTAANDTTNKNINITEALRTIVRGNTLVRPSTDNSLTTTGLWVDSSTTPQAAGTQVIGNIFTFCKFNNQGVDNTLVEGNSFNVHDGMIPININPAGTADVGHNNLGAGSAFITFAAGDTTPSVARGFRFKTANTDNTLITQFDDGYIGQEITVYFADSKTKLGDAAASGMFRLQGAVDHTYAVHDAASFIYIGGSVWVEKSRSVN
jgi:hypothetical protein